MIYKELESAKILIVDDEVANVRLLERMLKQQNFHSLVSTTDSRLALPLFIQHQPDLILLDLMMPHIDGFQVMEQLKTLYATPVFTPILVLTADAFPETKRRALSFGAKDFLTKPFDPVEAMLRIRNLLESRYLYLSLQNQNSGLEEKVQERTRDLQDAQIEVLERLAQASEFRDDDTGRHTYRVGHYSALLARELRLPDSVIDMIRRAAPLHDVGKIGISDTILLKPGKLTPEEFDTMKTHARIGADILANGRSQLVREAQSIALTHHERWDGTGYPNRLSGIDIPIEGRIVAIVDVFDALTHDRPYKKAWPVEEACAEIASQSGRQFDPDVVEVFMRLHQQNLYTV